MTGNADDSDADDMHEQEESCPINLKQDVLNWASHLSSYNLESNDAVLLSLAAEKLT